MGEAVDLTIRTWDALKGASWPIFVQIAERTRDAGLTSAQSSLLFVLLTADEPLTPLAVARILKVTPGTVTGTLNPLEEMGLIERLRGRTEDRRVVHLRLTPRGRALMKRWLDSCREAIEARIGALSPEEQRQLIALLSKIAPPQSGVPEGLASALKLTPPHATKRSKARGPR